VEVHPKGAALSAFLPPGTTVVGLRSLLGGSLWGTAEVISSGVTVITEGLGPEVLLAPGATRFFQFSVTRKGEVGIGVHADSDVVECSLFEGGGRPIGSGLVQMPTLSPGDYLIALHVPESGSTVRARPAVAGITPPDTGPPEEVIQRYLDAARAGSFEPVKMPTPPPMAKPTPIREPSPWNAFESSSQEENEQEGEGSEYGEEGEDSSESGEDADQEEGDETETDDSAGSGEES
jgi:hypothetical protein